jgi:hypothetical protein
MPAGPASPDLGTAFQALPDRSKFMLICIVFERLSTEQTSETLGAAVHDVETEAAETLAALETTMPCRRSRSFDQSNVAEASAVIDVCRLTTAHLQDFVDGKLNPVLHEAVEAYLWHHPEAMARITQ